MKKVEPEQAGNFANEHDNLRREQLLSLVADDNDASECAAADLFLEFGTSV